MSLKLDKWIAGSGSSEEKTDKKSGLPELNCSNCIERYYCEQFNRLKILEDMKPRRESEQTILFDINRRENTKPHKVRMQEWGKEYYPLWIKCDNCVRRRAYIHKVLGHKKFDI